MCVHISVYSFFCSISSEHLDNFLRGITRRVKSCKLQHLYIHSTIVRLPRNNWVHIVVFENEIENPYDVEAHTKKENSTLPMKIIIAHMHIKYLYLSLLKFQSILRTRASAIQRALTISVNGLFTLFGAILTWPISSWTPSQFCATECKYECECVCFCVCFCVRPQKHGHY